MGGMEKPLKAWLEEYSRRKEKKMGVEGFSLKSGMIESLHSKEGVVERNGVGLFILQKNGERNSPRIHFWIGKESSQGDQQAVGRLVVDLDGQLFERNSVQYREMEGHESPLFLSLFNHFCVLTKKLPTEPENTKRLFRLHDDVIVRIEEQDHETKTLCPSGTYLLLTKRDLYLWTDQSAGEATKFKILSAVGWFQSEVMNYKCFVHLSQGNDSKVWDSFVLNGNTSSSASSLDQSKDLIKKPSVRLCKSKDAVGKTLLTELPQNQIQKQSLTSNEAFIVDPGPQNGVYLVDGEDVPGKELHTTWRKGIEYLRRSHYPSSTPLIRHSRLVQPLIFQNVFPPSSSDSAPSSLTLWNPGCLDSDEIQIWRVENFYLIPVGTGDFGTFYSEDCYLILVRSSSPLLYHWEGKATRPEERRIAMELAAKLNLKELNGTAVQIRVVQDREPIHFLALFCPRMVVLLGGHVSGYKPSNASGTYESDGVRLFRLRQAKVVQVPERSTSLEKDCCYIVETPKTTYIWLKPGEDEDEKSLAKEFARLVLPLKNPVIVEEGSEPPEFWEYVSSKPKSKKKQALEEAQNNFCRLFRWRSDSTDSHYFVAVEPISQQGFTENAVLLLHTPHEIYLWFGSGTPLDSLKTAGSLVKKYLDSDPFGGLCEQIPIAVFRQGSEPSCFRSLIPKWTNSFWSKAKQIKDLEQRIKSDNKKLEAELKNIDDTATVHSMEVLSLKTEDLPPGIDPTKRESYLSEEEFRDLFGMERMDYLKAPLWKQVELKKKLGLF